MHLYDARIRCTNTWCSKLLMQKKIVRQPSTLLASAHRKYCHVLFWHQIRTWKTQASTYQTWRTQAITHHTCKKARITATPRKSLQYQHQGSTCNNDEQQRESLRPCIVGVQVDSLHVRVVVYCSLQQKPEVLVWCPTRTAHHQRGTVGCQLDCTAQHLWEFGLWYTWYTWAASIDRLVNQIVWIKWETQSG